MNSCARDSAGFEPSRAEMFGPFGHRDGSESSGTRGNFERTASEGARRRSSKAKDANDRDERGLDIRLEADANTGLAVRVDFQGLTNGQKGNLDAGLQSGENLDEAAANDTAASTVVAGQGKLHRRAA